MFVKNLLNYSLEALKVATLSVLLAGFSGCPILKNFLDCNKCHHEHGHHHHAHNEDDALTFKLANETNSTGDVIASFKEPMKINLKYSLNLPKEITSGDVEDMLKMAMGSMGMGGQQFSLSSLPVQQQQMIISNVVESKCLIRSKLGEAFKDEDFLKSLSATISQSIEQSVAMWFQASVEKNLTISEAEINEEFEKNKSRYIKQLAGTKTVGVKFESLDDAKEFKKSLGKNTSMEEFGEAAKQENAESFKDFGLIAPDFSRGVSPVISMFVRNTDNSSASNPVIDIKSINDKEHWVLCLGDKQEAEYLPLEERNPKIESSIKRSKTFKVFTDEMKALRAKSGVEIKGLGNISSKDEINSDMFENLNEADFDEIDENMASNENANQVTTV